MSPVEPHLSVHVGYVDEEVLGTGLYGRTVDGDAVDPLLVAGAPHPGGLRKPATTTARQTSCSAAAR